MICGEASGVFAKFFVRVFFLFILFKLNALKLPMKKYDLDVKYQNLK